MKTPAVPTVDIHTHVTSSSPVFILEGEKEALENLYSLYAPSLYGWIVKFLPDTATADQVLINTFLSVQENRHLLNSTSSGLLIPLIRLCNKEIAKFIGHVLLREQLSFLLMKERGTNTVNTLCKMEYQSLPAFEVAINKRSNPFEGC